MRTLDRRAHHRFTAERVHVEHPRAEPRDVRARPFDGVGDVVELEIEEDRPLLADAPYDVGSGGREQLEPDLQHADVRREGVRESGGAGGVADVECHDQRVLGTRPHPAIAPS
jgi:hypothetical protein